MASPTPNKNMTYPAHGGAVNAWDAPLNADFDQLDLNLGGVYPITISSTITGVTYGSTGTTASSTASALTFPSSLAQNLYYPLTGTITQNLDLVFPAAGQLCSINNGSSGSFAVTAYPAGSSAVAVPITQGGASCLFINSGIAQLVDSNFRSLALQNNNTLLGNVFGSSAAPIPLTIGAGLTPGSSISATISAPGFSAPGGGGFKNLAIKVLTNTTVGVSADYVTLTDGTHYLTVPVSQTLNLGSAGSVNQLDTGAIAQGVDYTIWVISDGQGNVGTLGSTSLTSPTLPTSYPYKAYYGTVKTSTTVAQLYGTWQIGRDVQYKVGLAQTVIPRIVVNGIAGSYSGISPTLTGVTVAGSGFSVPLTASSILLNVTNDWKSNSAGDVLIAPSVSWGGVNNGPIGSNGMIYPIWLTTGLGEQKQCQLILEGTSIGYTGDTAGCAVACFGWTENI